MGSPFVDHNLNISGSNHIYFEISDNNKNKMVTKKTVSDWEVFRTEIIFG